VEVDPRELEAVDDQLQSDRQDEQVSGCFKGGEALEELQEQRGGKAHHDDAEHAADEDDPEFVRNGNGRKDRVDGKGDVGQFDHDHDLPKVSRAFVLLIVVLFFSLDEVLEGDEGQVAAPDELHPDPLHELADHREREKPEKGRANEPVGQSLALLLGRKAAREHREHQGIVDGKDALEEDEEADGAEIVKGEHGGFNE